MPSVIGPYYAELLSGYQLWAGLQGLSVTLVSAEAGRERIIEQVIDLAGKVDGMTITHSTVPDEVVAFIASRIPVVVSGRAPVPGCDAIGVLNADPVGEIVQHLICHGARTPRFVGVSNTRDVRQRYAGYLETVMEAGLDVPMAAYHFPAIEEFGNRVADEVLQGDTRCDALVCANDELALSVMKALSRRGIRCPDDILITGFDDIMPARYSMPGLTTVRQPTRKLGSMLAERLYERVAFAEPARSPITLPCEVVLRGSCGCPES